MKGWKKGEDTSLDTAQGGDTIGTLHTAGGRGDTPVVHYIAEDTSLVHYIAEDTPLVHYIQHEGQSAAVSPTTSFLCNTASQSMPLNHLCCFTSSIPC